MIRININIALIDMLSPTYRKSPKDSNFSHECFQSSHLNSNVSHNNHQMSDEKMNQGDRPKAMEKYLLDFLSVSSALVINLKSHAHTQWNLLDQI
jgi:hypothetical protein